MTQKGENLGEILPRLKDKLQPGSGSSGGLDASGRIGIGVKPVQATLGVAVCLGEIAKGQDCSFCSRPKTLPTCGLYRKRWREMLTLSEIPPRYWNAAELFAKPPKPLVKAYKVIATYLGKLDTYLEAGHGLLLKGPPGTSKTSVAVAVAMETIRLRGKRALEDPWAKPGASPVLFVPVAKLLDKLFSLKAVETREWALYEERLQRVPLLLLDDLGAEHPEGWVQTKIDSLIAERYNANKTIIITTNLQGSELLSRYAGRIMDRLCSSVFEIDLSLSGSESLRQLIEL